MPRILIISLKRFKQGRSKYQMAGSGQKLDTLVDFPLEGLDMTPFVLSKTQKSQQGPLIYDCFAVSNHHGSAGFGHYTAFGKNYQTREWYNFDDTTCTAVNGMTGFSRKEIVSNAAYSLFYRLRNEKSEEYDQVNFDALK